MPEIGPKYTCNDAISFFTQTFDLVSYPNMQDWEIEAADSPKLATFIAFFKAALASSLLVKDDAVSGNTWRVGISAGEYVTLKQSGRVDAKPPVFHGYAVDWKDLQDEERNLLRKHGFAKPHGSGTKQQPS